MTDLVVSVVSYRKLIANESSSGRCGGRTGAAGSRGDVNNAVRMRPQEVELRESGNAVDTWQ